VGYSRKTFALLCGNLLAALIFTSGCAPTDREPADKTLGKKEPAREQATDNRPIRVVATYSILGDWVQTIGGDEIELTVLVGAEGDAHTYEPTPRDSVALAEADILFENGMGFEVWLERLFQASNSAARRVVVSESIKPRELVVSESRTEIDPHVWHLPENAKLMVEAIALALEKADPAHAAKYRDRQRSYVGQLNELDAWITQQAASIPAQRRKLVTTHDTFGYLADRYDFEVLSVLGSVSSESSDPSAGQVAEIIERIRTLKIPAIFAENILNPKLTLKIAEEAGVKIVPTLYTDALGPAGSPGQDYLGLMRFNVKTIVEALQ
jgi:zinc/manganese transport system substrate-binding protein